MYLGNLTFRQLKFLTKAYRRLHFKHLRFTTVPVASELDFKALKHLYSMRIINAESFNNHTVTYHLTNGGLDYVKYLDPQPKFFNSTIHYRNLTANSIDNTMISCIVADKERKPSGMDFYFWDECRNYMPSALAVPVNILDLLTIIYKNHNERFFKFKKTENVFTACIDFNNLCILFDTTHRMGLTNTDYSSHITLSCYLTKLGKSFVKYVNEWFSNPQTKKIPFSDKNIIHFYQECTSGDVTLGTIRDFCKCKVALTRVL